VGGAEQLAQLVADPLHADDLEPAGHVAHGRHDLGATAKPSCARSARAQHAQRVVAEGLLRRAGRAQDAGREVVQAAVQVDEGVRRPPVGQRDRHGVDR
jgi:hypothetical protein